MIASLLPGLRELRAPLAAGYIWLVFVFLVAGTPTNVEDAPGAIRDLLTVVGALGTASTSIALSFVAYLLGSVSQDAFGQVLPRGLLRLSRLMPRRPDLGGSHLLALIRRAEELALDSLPAELTRIAPEEPLKLTSLSPDQYDGFRSAMRELDGVIEAIVRTLDELVAAGASEAEKPEALRPMVEAEGNLRVAVVPPLIATMTVLTLTESWVWIVGFVFTAALFLQAVARRTEAAQLADQAYRAGETRDASAELQQLRKKVRRADVTMRDLRDVVDASARVRDAGRPTIGVAMDT